MARRPDSAYLDTIARMEREIAMVDVSAGAASMSVSLRRIANALAMQQAITLLKEAERGGALQFHEAKAVVDGVGPTLVKLVQEYIEINKYAAPEPDVSV